MTATNVIAFPFPAKRYAEPPRQALRHDGTPLRVGDAVLIPCRGHSVLKFAGTIEELIEPDCFDAFQLYRVICRDGFRRMVTAREIEAVS
jgi:hypothetical protein